MLRFSVSVRLMVGYAIVMGSLILISIYNYRVFSEVLEGKESIRNYNAILLTSNLIERELLQARLSESNFLRSNNPHDADKVRIHIQQLLEAGQNLLQTVKLLREQQHYLDLVVALVEGAEDYVLSFSEMESSLLQRGLDEQSGMLGRLKEKQASMQPQVSELSFYQIRTLEQDYRFNYLNVDSPQYFQRMQAMVQSTAVRPFPETLQYLELFRELTVVDQEIKDRLRSLQQASNVIELYVKANLQSAQQTLDQQAVIDERQVSQQNLSLIVLSLTLMVLGAISLLFMGWESLELSKAFQEQSAILEAISDGLVAVNREGIIKIINRQARSILGLPDNQQGKDIRDVIPNTQLFQVMESGEAEYRQELKINKVVIVTTRVPVQLGGKIVGGVACFQKKSDLSHLAEQLTQVKLFIEALRTHNHEFQNKLHTIQGMVQLGQYQEVIAYIQDQQNSHQLKVSLYMDRIQDAAVSSLLLGKFNRCNELGISMFLEENSQLEVIPSHLDLHAIISVLGNLIQNAMDAVESQPLGERKVKVMVRDNPQAIYFSVTDNGPGIPKIHSDKIFQKGFSTKTSAEEELGIPMLPSENMGLGLYITKNHVENLGGKIQFRTGEETVFEVTLPKGDA